MPMSPRPDAWKTACARAAAAPNMEGVALAWVSAGFAVCPAEHRPSEGSRYKGSLISPYEPATTDEEVRRLWAKFPDALTWVPGGKDNDFFVIDVDASPPHAVDGLGPWRKLCLDNGGAPTRVHKSPSGGEHWIYQWAPDREIGGGRGNLPFELVKDEKAWGIDVLGAGKGFIVPGSMPGYTVHDDSVPGKAPLWLLDVLLPGEKPRAKRGGKRAGAGRKRGAVPPKTPVRKLDEAVEAVRSAADKTRDATVGKYVVHIGSLVGAGRLDERAVRDQLGRAALANIGGGEAFADKVQRAISDGMLNPEYGEGPDGEWLDVEDFVHEGESNQFIYRPTRKMWPGASVNRRVFPIQDGEKENGDPRYVLAADWIPRHQAVEQMSWKPGDDEFIEDKLINEGGWFAHGGATVYNRYMPPVRVPKEGPVNMWIDHVRTLYGNESAEHIFNWFAHRVQRPGEKINHALLLGGGPGVGKDTILEPLREAVGGWNFKEVSPKNLLERFNPWAEAVVLRISEAKDLGDMDRYAFYDATKTLIAAPPETMIINPKLIKPYTVPNLCGVIITTNYQLHGIYLPADDRRHFVVWTDVERTTFDDEYWNRMWGWYREGGFEAIMYWLGTRDLSRFDPKAPPKHTEAFDNMVANSRSAQSEEIELALIEMGHPEIVSWADISRQIAYPASEHYNDKKVFRQIAGWLEENGYRQVKDVKEAKNKGRWLIASKPVTLYGRKDLTPKQAQAAVRPYITAAEKKIAEDVRRKDQRSF
jgi:Family of unknown function (DUF5906)/Bifunctional DNA primase/polymerase, N-terminal